MRLKHLQSALSSVPTKQFPNPNITLEQYATSPELASYVINFAQELGDVGESNSVLDLGCGTGMLAIGSALVGSKLVICVDIDETAISVARHNVEGMELEDDCVVEFILAKVSHTPSMISEATNRSVKGRGGRGKGGRGGKRGRGGRHGNNHNQGRTLEPNICTTKPLNGDDDDGIPLLPNCVDTVLTNPPFGTKHNAGIDVSFLRTAIRLARKSVYSFHKSSTSPYLLKIVQSWGYEVEVVARMKFEIPKMYKFHKQDEIDVEVDLIRVSLVPASL